MLSVRLLPQTDLNLTHCAERMNAFTACSSLGMITPAALDFPIWRTTSAGDSVRFHCVRALTYQLKQSQHRLSMFRRAGRPTANTADRPPLRTRASTPLAYARRRVASSTTPRIALVHNACSLTPMQLTPSFIEGATYNSPTGSSQNYITISQLPI